MRASSTDDGVLAVHLLHQHPDVVVAARRHVLAHEVGADRQLAMAAVDEHRELDRCAAARSPSARPSPRGSCGR